MKYPEINTITKQYWSDEDFVLLRGCKKVSDVYVVASKILHSMPEEVAQVCGPITSGGKGSIEANLEFLNYSIHELQKTGIHVFDQMPFEETLHRVMRENSDSQKYENVLTDFYEPLFLSHKIKTLYFVPGWESSRGANWEYQKAKDLGMEIRLL